MRLKDVGAVLAVFQVVRIEALITVFAVRDAVTREIFVVATEIVFFRSRTRPLAKAIQCVIQIFTAKKFTFMTFEFLWRTGLVKNVKFLVDQIRATDAVLAPKTIA